MLRHYSCRSIREGEEVLKTLAPDYKLLVIAKSDQIDQERKLAQSGLDKLFNTLEIVFMKTLEAYVKILTRYHVAPTHSVMMTGIPSNLT